MIYGAADDADWTSEEVWYRANPSLGHTIDIGKVWNACEGDFEFLIDKSKGSPVWESLLEKAVCQCPPCGLDHGNSICGYGKRVAWNNPFS